jgi:hypothetical protein
MFHADGLTDMAKLRVAFRNFANEPRNRNTMCEQNAEFLIGTITGTHSYHRTSKWKLTQLSNTAHLFFSLCYLPGLYGHSLQIRTLCYIAKYT